MIGAVVEVKEVAGHIRQRCMFTEKIAFNMGERQPLTWKLTPWPPWKRPDRRGIDGCMETSIIKGVVAEARRPLRVHLYYLTVEAGSDPVARCDEEDTIPDRIMAYAGSS
jgi:hypothetical protein